MASNPDAAVAEPALATEAARLRELIRLNQWLAPLGVPAVGAMWWTWGGTPLAIETCLVATTVIFQAIAAYHANRKRIQQAITWLVFSIWLPTLGMAVMAPDVWAIPVVLCVLSVLVVVSFADPRHQLRLIGGASAIVLIGGYFRVDPWMYAFPAGMNPSMLGFIEAAGSGVGAMVCMLAVWQSNSRLVVTVEQLRESEHDLERKVERRTAALERSREKLAQARDEALAANQHKSAFLANMSHELRTPLNAVIGFSEMLSEKVFGELNEKQDEYVSDIHGSGKHLLSLINDILDLSKIEAGKLELSLSTFPLEEAIAGALMLTRERAFGRGIQQVPEIESDLGSIEADERKVKQILVNLLSNAVKFTDAGGVVTVRARRLEDAFEIAVADTGIGIAPEEQSLVFEEFRQAGEDDAKRAEGTGLGLALVKRLTELHGGRIHLESELGRGSCFTVTLPLSVPEALRSEEDERWQAS